MSTNYSLNPYDPTLGAFQSDIYPVGIDLRRSVISNDGGFYVSDPAAVFQAGQVLAQESSGQFTVCDGLGASPVNVPYGFAKWNKLTTLVSNVVDDPVTLTGTVASNLSQAGLFGAPGPGFVRVSSTPTGTAGTTYTEGSGNDYTVNYTNGTIVRTAGSTIPSGATVYVTFQWYIPTADLDFQGRNFWNFLDEVTQAQGRIAIITNWTLLFTCMYDPANTYSLGQQLYVGDIASGIGGLLTTSSGGRPAFAKVFQLPSAADPFMGVVSPGHS
jgi:hypothetical protein